MPSQHGSTMVCQRPAAVHGSASLSHAATPCKACPAPARRAELVVTMRLSSRSLVVAEASTGALPDRISSGCASALEVAGMGLSLPLLACMHLE